AAVPARPPVVPQGRPTGTDRALLPPQPHPAARGEVTGGVPGAREEQEQGHASRPPRRPPAPPRQAAAPHRGRRPHPRPDAPPPPAKRPSPAGGAGPGGWDRAGIFSPRGGPGAARGISSAAAASPGA